MLPFAIGPRTVIARSPLDFGRSRDRPQVKNRDVSRFFEMVPVEGLEPPLPCGKQILSLSRLPFRHTGRRAFKAPA